MAAITCQKTSLVTNSDNSDNDPQPAAYLHVLEHAEPWPLLDSHANEPHQVDVIKVQHQL